MSQHQNELIARASDPNADLTTLHELAQNYPGLRPYIAANPRTYPALLDWLAQLGDPAIDAALATRNANPHPASGAPTRAEHNTTSITHQDAEATAVMPAAALNAASAGAGESTAVSATTSDSALSPAGSTAALPVTHTTPYPVTAPATQLSPTGAPVNWSAQSEGVFGVGNHNDADDDPSGRRGGHIWLWLLAAVALVLVIAVAVWFFFTGKDSDAPTVGNTITASQPSEQASEVSTVENTTPSATAQATPTPTPSPTPSPTPALAAPAPEGAIETSSFSAPSGNIACTLSGGSTSCTIAQYTFDPGIDSCQAGSPFTVVIDAEGNATTNCSTPMPSTAGALSYGDAATHEGYACISAEDGVTCWSEKTGQGFVIARQGASAITR